MEPELSSSSVLNLTVGNPTSEPSQNSDEDLLLESSRSKFTPKILFKISISKFNLPSL